MTENGPLSADGDNRRTWPGRSRSGTKYAQIVCCCLETMTYFLPVCRVITSVQISPAVSRRRIDVHQPNGLKRLIRSNTSICEKTYSFLRSVKSIGGYDRDADWRCCVDSSSRRKDPIRAPVIYLCFSALHVGMQRIFLDDGPKAIDSSSHFYCILELGGHRRSVSSVSQTIRTSDFFHDVSPHGASRSL